MERFSLSLHLLFVIYPDCVSKRRLFFFFSLFVDWLDVNLFPFFLHLLPQARFPLEQPVFGFSLVVSLHSLP